MPTPDPAAVVTAEELKEPADLKEAFAAAPEAHALWKTLTPIARRDFIRWITLRQAGPDPRAPDRKRLRHDLQGQAARVLLRHQPVEDCRREIEVQEVRHWLTRAGSGLQAAACNTSAPR
jgi:hypothetical protein